VKLRWAGGGRSAPFCLLMILIRQVIAAHGLMIIGESGGLSRRLSVDAAYAASLADF
jgi:hypothetical protein